MRSNVSREKLNKKKVLIAGLIGFIVIIGIVLGVLKLTKKTNQVDTQAKEPEKEEVEEVKEEPIKIIDMNSDTRPYAIMINCKSEALPQVGLQDAYMVYEETVEGGITRMIAFFKDKDISKVGSVRSARVQYLPFVFEHDAIYVHAGGATEALNRIANEKINDVDVA